MKKRLIAALLALSLMFCASAFAASPKAMFKYVKNTLKCLAAGEYDTIVAQLPVSGISPTAEEWEKLAVRGFDSLFGSAPQTKYAVAYKLGGRWRIAVPVREPSKDSVEVLFLDTEDGTSFCGYGHSTWGDTVIEYRKSDSVIWNEEYLGSASRVESDEIA